MEKNYDVLIIGGGMSGLVAAKTLIDHDPDIRVAILEKSSSPGGRILAETSKIGDAVTEVELGASRITSTQSYILTLMKDLKITTSPISSFKGKTTVQFSNRIVKNRNGVFSWFHNLELQRLLWILDNLSSKVCILDPYGGPNGETLDNTSFSSWLEANCWQRSVAEELCTRVRCCFGSEPGQISLLFLLTVAATSDGVRSLFFKERLHVENGTMKNVVDKLMEHLEAKVDILTENTVERVSQTESRVLVGTSDNTEFMANKLIVCLPPSQQRRIDWTPDLPALKTFVNSNTPMGHYIKYAILFDEPFWEKFGLSGSVMSSGGRSRDGCECSPVTVTYPSKAGSHYILYGLVAGKPAVQWQTKNDLELKLAVLDTLADLLGSWIQNQRGVLVESWLSDGVSCPVPGTMYAWPAVRLVHGNVHFGGTETSTRWMGSLEGGVQAGIRTGLEVLGAIRPQSLHSEDLQFLSEFSLENISKNPAPSRHVYRWTILLPVSYLVMMYLAVKMRNRYASLLIPFH